MAPVFSKNLEQAGYHMHGDGASLAIATVFRPAVVCNKKGSHRVMLNIIDIRFDTDTDSDPDARGFIRRQ